MRLLIVTIAATGLLAGCSDFQLFGGGAGGGGGGGAEPVPTQRPQAAAATSAPTGTAGGNVVAPPRAVTATVGALDRVSEAEKAEARNAAANSTNSELGTATVSLGNPGDTGLWVKSGLVTSETPGVVTAANGQSVAVALRPLGGSGGAQISLSALQALGLPLAGLHSVTLSSS